MEKILFDVSGVMMDGLGRVDGKDSSSSSNLSTTDANARVKLLEAELEQLRAASSDALPGDFPGKVALADAGVTTRAQLMALDEDALKAIKGVGPATLEQIKAALV